MGVCQAAVLLLIAATLLPGCRRRVVVSDIDRASCTQQVTDAFGDQDMTLIAVRPVDRGLLFRPPILEALDRVCRAFEDVMTDDLISMKCLTSLPIMDARPAAAKVVVARDELPMTVEDALAFQRLVLQLEFATGDVVDAAGSSKAFIHLPAPSFEGVDLRAVYEEAARAEEDVLEMAFDGGGAGDLAAYRAFAGEGPSSRYFVGIFDSGVSGGIKEPANLKALERFQKAAETVGKVAQTFSVADDLKVVRRGLHRGDPTAAVIPGKRAEVAQLLLALSMAPSGNAFGPRIDSEERIALVRVNLAAVNGDPFTRIGRRLDGMLGAEAPEGGRAFLCLE